jgi:putative membrane protein
MSDRVPRRFPRSVYDTGTDPDPRFSLANERTYLAWIRTTLALLAAGVALEALRVPAAEGLRLAAALTFVVLAVLAALQAWIGWVRTERALREDRPLPAPALGVVITAGVVGACVLLGLGLLL